MKNNILFKIGIVSSFFFFAYLVFAYNPGTNFIICTSTVNQPSCYSGGYPTPTVNWTMVGGSSQISYQVQIDQNQNFNNPEIDSGIVNSTNKFYEVNTSGLSYGTNYYWRVRVKDNYNSWSNWVEAESSFRTPYISVCASTVNQPSCYSGGYSTPTINWTVEGGGSQISFHVQIDNNSNFSSPEIDSGIVNSTNKFYEVNTSGLSHDTGYYWRVRVKDNSGNWSEWTE